MPATKKKNARPRPRFARLEARISPDQKHMLQRAAALEGRSLTDFVVGHVVQEAKRVVQDNEIIRLTEREREAFVAALLNPRRPKNALVKAMKTHIRQVGDHFES